MNENINLSVGIKFRAWHFLKLSQYLKCPILIFYTIEALNIFSKIWRETFQRQITITVNTSMSSILSVNCSSTYIYIFHTGILSIQTNFRELTQRCTNGDAYLHCIYSHLCHILLQNVIKSMNKSGDVEWFKQTRGINRLL